MMVVQRKRIMPEYMAEEWAERADYYRAVLNSGVYEDVWGEVRPLTPAKEKEYRAALEHAQRKVVAANGG